MRNWLCIDPRQRHRGRTHRDARDGWRTAGVVAPRDRPRDLCARRTRRRGMADRQARGRVFDERCDRIPQLVPRHPGASRNDGSVVTLRRVPNPELQSRCAALRSRPAPNLRSSPPAIFLKKRVATPRWVLRSFSSSLVSHATWITRRSPSYGKWPWKELSARLKITNSPYSGFT